MLQNVVLWEHQCRAWVLIFANVMLYSTRLELDLVLTQPLALFVFVSSGKLLHYFVFERAFWQILHKALKIVISQHIKVQRVLRAPYANTFMKFRDRLLVFHCLLISALPALIKENSSCLLSDNEVQCQIWIAGDWPYAKGTWLNDYETKRCQWLP